MRGTMPVRLPPLLSLSLLALSACGPTDIGARSETGGRGGSDAGGADPGPGTVRVGVPGGADGLSFQPLVNGSELRLETFGQGGTHVLLGVRCVGFGSRAFISITLRNSNTGVEIVAPAPARPQLLFCSDGDCDLVPITVMAGGLTKPGEERDGLPVVVRADVHNEAGTSGRAEATAVLSTADL